MKYAVVKSGSRSTLFIGYIDECEAFINRMDEYERKHVEITGIY